MADSTGGYWSGITTQRIRRRRLLKGVGAMGAGALALSLVGCGGGDSDDTTDRSGLITKPVDTSAQAKRGGTLPHYISADITSFDGLRVPDQTGGSINGYAYSAVVLPKVYNRAKGESVGSAIEPEAMESYEVTPDSLQITFKVRPNVKFDPRPPTNSRAMDAQDFMLTWQQFVQSARARGSFSNAVSKDAPITSVTAPDNRTIVIKLAFPTAVIMAQFTNTNLFTIHPREEFEGGFDPRQTMRGSGPYMVTDYQRSSSFKFERNPNYWRGNVPYIDVIDQPIIEDYSTGAAQFRLGRIWKYPIRPEEVLQTKLDVPDLSMIADENGFSTSIQGGIWYDVRPGGIYLDERLRKAMSHLIDRDLWIDTFYYPKAYADHGIDVERRWNSHIASGHEGFWIDPKNTKEFGDAAKYFKYDPAEAKKLVSAATGGKGVVESDWNTAVNNPAGGELYTKGGEVMKGMLEANGDFKFNTRTWDSSTEWTLNVHPGASGRNYSGAAWTFVGTFSGDVGDYFTQFFLRGGTYYKFEENYPNDATFTKLVQDVVQEFDVGRRATLLKQFQQYTAEKMYFIPKPGSGLDFNLSWPWVGNSGAFASRATSNLQTTLPLLWIDESKRKA